MTHRPNVVCSRELAARWCALAERRLAHLTELFDSGRWRRYYSDKSLLDDIRNAKAAVQTWKALSLEPLVPSVQPKLVPVPAPEAVMVAPPAPPLRLTAPVKIATRRIELPPSIETVLASEIIVAAEIDVPEEEVIEPDMTAVAPRIDMAALAQALSIGIGPEAEDDEPMVDLDAIERRYPALAVAY